ncbi:hypothetical protein XI04_27535 [Bradyrhizobium sp. CCBAU 11430]|uniref:hypothetical protein n=1 Tax=unclassified Bradyrhizobium TaxID=2631580 RepID=UPI0023066927|nr:MULTISPECIES: hypothetical protein [unclassified Bradyrhizobium]MDA9413822.1 hypothetical protein [Bradyrhizobium sp. CCBAU 25360]MDA9516766.1 hypothetical protein [Bradyrhizobium sp. CCBAU 11430]
MPARPKKNKHRAIAAPEDWEEVFETGYDGFSDLKCAGVWVDENGYPDREEARAAWQRFGRAFLEEHAIRNPNRPGRYGRPWALTEFGQPR